MANFALLDATKTVTKVLVVADEAMIGADGTNDELLGISLLTKLFGPGDYVQTFRDANATRKNYAGIGFKYDIDRDAFISPKPFESWVLDETTCRWTAPVPYPTDGSEYFWDEESVTWTPL